MNSSDLLAFISIIIALASALIAYSLFRLSIRQVSGDVLYRIIDRLEEPSMRELRRKIYSLDRDAFREWDAELQSEVDRWGAELDVISTLLSQETNITGFFNLYGDVFLRSIYQMAPYGVYQRTQRGDQFWLPIEVFGTRMMKVWGKAVKNGKYSRVIGVPGAKSVSISVETFKADRNCQSFLKKVS